MSVGALWVCIIICITAIFSLCLKDFTGMNNKIIYNVCVSMSIAMRGGMKNKGAKSISAMEKYDRNRIINIYICIFILYVASCSMILLLYVILY